MNPSSRFDLESNRHSPRTNTVRRLIIEDDEIQHIPMIDDSFQESRGSFETLCDAIIISDAERSIDLTIDTDDISGVITKLNLDLEEDVLVKDEPQPVVKENSITSGETVTDERSSFAETPSSAELVVRNIAADIAHTPRGSISRNRYSEAQFNAITTEAVVKFNMKPSEARNYLMDQNVISADPADFALWISATPRLSKRRIGEFIGKEDPMCRECCTALFVHYNLQGPLDVALRQLMRQFRLPGEAQQIDRILERFSEQYAVQNPESEFSADTVYVLAFSLILLNTDLHNPSIPAHKKMTLDQFIANNRGIHSGGNIDRQYLVGLYDRIRDDEIRMEEKDMWESEIVTFMAPILSGWLSKKSDGMLGPWKTRWFVLTDGCLYYFLTPKDETPRCIIPLDNTRIGRGSYTTDIVIIPATGVVVKSSKLVQNGHMAQGRHSQFLLRTKSRDDREAWVSALQIETERFRPLHDLFLRIQLRKQSKELVMRLPDSLAEGWMRKRGDLNKGWKRRYFVLYPERHGVPATLYYYINAQMAQRMKETGTETQQGFLTLLDAASIHVARDRSPTKAVAIEVVTSNRVWVFAPDDAWQFTYWLGALSETLTKEQQRVSVAEETKSST